MTDITEALSRATQAMSYAAQAVHDHFEITDPERQSISDRRHLKQVLTRARDSLAFADRVSVGEPTGQEAELLGAYRKLCESVLGKLREAEVIDDTNGRLPSDLDFNGDID